MENNLFKKGIVDNTLYCVASEETIGDNYIKIFTANEEGGLVSMEIKFQNSEKATALFSKEVAKKIGEFLCGIP